MPATTPSDRMSHEEKRAGASLAAVFALRMLGLFLILPVFAIYAKTLPSGNDVALVGIAAFEWARRRFAQRWHAVQEYIEVEMKKREAAA